MMSESNEDSQKQPSSGLDLESMKSGLLELKDRLKDRSLDLKAKMQEKQQDIAVIRSEERQDRRFEATLEDMITGAGYGFVAGGLVSLLLPIRARGRMWLTGFATGCGTGASWQNCQYRFYHKKVPKSDE